MTIRTRRKRGLQYDLPDNKLTNLPTFQIVEQSEMLADDLNHLVNRIATVVEIEFEAA
jgi:hypothetical protein